MRSIEDLKRGGRYGCEGGDASQQLYVIGVVGGLRISTAVRDKGVRRVTHLNSCA